ncbi:MAG: TetR/AcrR family transcriptional regulator [Pseudomonadota bacterium]
MGRREEKREALREALITAATGLIEAVGHAHLTARDVTSAAGCALGSLYTAFADLDDLILHANARTLTMLREDLERATAATEGAASLRALARAYARFARQRNHLWSALFIYAMEDLERIPAWYVNGHHALLTLVAGALAEIPLDEPAEALEARARSYFAAVHGVVAMSLHSPFVGHPEAVLEAEIDALLDTLIAGLRQPGTV